jgi:heterodisulfide reductase subunit A2
MVIDTITCTRCGECVEVCKPGAIDLNESVTENEIVVGGVILATGFAPYAPPTGEFGFGNSDRILTLFQLERLLATDGPSKGCLVVSGSIPERIAFIMCVGSLGTTENAHPYCSRMCCASSLKNMLKIRAQHPHAVIYALYKDIRTYARHDESLYERASEQRVKFINYERRPTVNLNGNDLTVEVEDATLQERLHIPVDLVVLAVGMSPSTSLGTVRSIVKIGCSSEGFLREAHPKLRPVEAPADGVFLAGSVTSPKNVLESSMAGSATASKASALFAKGEFHVEPITAQVTETLCSGCGVCIAMCPYGAISRKIVGEKKRAEVDRALCKACGACVAACPSGAMQQAGFKDAQVIAQVEAISERRKK